jgi:DNA-binding CsgD family transcriptional regulator
VAPTSPVNPRGFAESRFGAAAVLSLQAAFERSRHPMLIADDHRRWVTGNAAACELLGVPAGQIPWRVMDDCTPAGEVTRLEEQWAAFLATGEAEGWYDLYVPNRMLRPVEFSATANVLPGRHLAVFIPPDDDAGEEPQRGEPRAWTPVSVEGGGRLELTEREREIMTLVASGLQNDEMAERLFLSPETVKSHVHNAMAKLGVHTRAHAVAIALVTGQITWEI